MAEGPTTGAGRHAASAATEFTVPTVRYRWIDSLIQVNNEECHILYLSKKNNPSILSNRHQFSVHVR
jgi:hypothetical protein